MRIRSSGNGLLANALASEEELVNIETAAKAYVKKSRQAAWSRYVEGITPQLQKAGSILEDFVNQGRDISGDIAKAIKTLTPNREPTRRDVLKALHTAILTAGDAVGAEELRDYYQELKTEGYALYTTHLYDESPKSPLLVKTNELQYSADAVNLNGYEIINKYFDELFAHNQTVIAFGEDVGKIGDVNQGFAGLQQKFGRHRIFDTGIREITIVGQAIGMAMRGLRPIAEIQYLDYILYGLQTLSDDAACMQLAHKGPAELSLDHPFTRPSPGRNLAQWVAHGTHAPLPPWDAHLRAQEYGAGSRVIQHLTRGK